jgi:Protein of unknown function (DUF3421)/Ricin-type beta-trefoil lectin domain-like
MKVSKNKWNLPFMILSTVWLLNFSTARGQTDIDTQYFYRLTTQWQGSGKSLDVVNDGVNNKIHLAPTNNVSGQYWKFTSLGNGYYRMTTQWLGDTKSLDVINDGRGNNQLHMAPTNSYTGQYWKIQPMGNGFYRLTTQWQGDGKSLDVVNDGVNNKLQLAQTGNYSGQYWSLSRLAPVSAPKKLDPKPKPTVPVTVMKTVTWIPYQGSIPANAVVGGKENGQQLVVCRTQYNGANHPGKVVAGMCNIGWGGQEIVSDNYEILINESGANLQWQSASGGVPFNAVSAGQEGNTMLFVGQAFMADGSIHPGKIFKVEDGTFICNYGYGGQEIVEKSNFKVLVNLDEGGR